MIFKKKRTPWLSLCATAQTTTFAVLLHQAEMNNNIFGFFSILY